MVAANSPRQDVAATPSSGAEPVADMPPASTALVPIAPVLQASAPRGARVRPDSTFVMHLIATATHAPQTRKLRQASASDGVARYTAARVAVRPRTSDGSRFKDIV
ncbi:hypothetical protein [Afipia felis]|uniref:Uncharacterized protein n=2 Tax=Afipia felis TaxID=1035 RepID=A0A380W4D6_AFIFE|nr:hypothetical protein [Afipia felis]EKS30607.1 hypothetical protein HMPREF9697_03135 [Afipia felis ATCC 53690]SUU75352.1 Uncharacterised protein [Afipia felis]SUU83419.1 Uncharacterised protein [Afipia felis]